MTSMIHDISDTEKKRVDLQMDGRFHVYYGTTHADPSLYPDRRVPARLWTWKCVAVEDSFLAARRTRLERV